MVYPGERTATAFVDYVSRRIPHNVKKLSEVQDILNWIYDVRLCHPLPPPLVTRLIHRTRKYHERSF